MKIRPRGERIVVKPLRQKEKTQGGIYLPETASKDKPQQGEVIAINRRVSIRILSKKKLKTLQHHCKNLWKIYFGTLRRVQEILG